MIFNQAAAQDASVPATDPAVYTTVVQVCQATEPGCVSVYRSAGDVLVTRGADIVANVPIQAPPLVEPAVEVRVTGEDALGATTVIVTVSGTEHGPYRLEQGHRVAISPDGQHFALLERREGRWWLVSDGRSHELPGVTQAMGARFAEDDAVLVDTLHDTTAVTVRVDRVDLAAASE